MKCIILAAGYATRLYPLTENFPKPLLKVGEKTILDHLIDDLKSGAEVDEFAVVTNHKFASHFSQWAPEGVKVVDDMTSTNETRLGAVRDIEFCLKSLGYKDDILVIAGDNVLDFSLNSFVRYAATKHASCIMRYYEPEPARLRKSAVVEVDPTDRVLTMEEKPSEPKSNWCCPPFYYYTADDAALIPQAISEGCAVDAPGSFASYLSSRRPLYAMQMRGKRYDIGTLESYKQVCQTYKGITEI